MAFPWLRLIDAALGMTDIARRVRAGREAPPTEMTPGTAPGGPLEARLAGVVVAALKEAFDRDTRRLELERDQIEAERARAEQALRLELRRQAGEREIGRLRLVAAIAVVSWLATLFFSRELLQGAARRERPSASGGCCCSAPSGAAFTAQSDRREPDRRRRRAVERAGRRDCAVADRRRARGDWRGRARLSG